MVEIPNLITPKELAAAIGCSERTLRYLARLHGCCRMFGKRMVFNDEDVRNLLEAVKQPARIPIRRARPAPPPVLPPLPVRSQRGRKPANIVQPDVLPIPFLKSTREKPKA